LTHRNSARSFDHPTTLMKKTSAFTLVEMLVVISIIAVIAGLALPAITGAMTRGQMTQAISNARQVYIATFSMVQDGSTTGDAKYGWPGDLANSTDSATKVTTVADYVQRLVDNDYLKPGDLKVFAAPGVTPWSGSYTPPAASGSAGTLSPTFDGDKHCAFKIYKVTDKDSSNALFMATKNFTYSSDQAKAIRADTVPFGDKGFVVFRKGGDGISFKKQQATSKQLIGCPPGGCDAATPPDEQTTDILSQK